MSETLRFLADENIERAIVTGLRRLHAHINCLTAREAGTLGLSDPDVLAFAAKENRILFSHDIQTMPHHFGTHLAQGLHSAGVIIIPQTMPIQQVIETLYIVWNASTPEEWINTIEFF